jgi:hypothetical protein
MSLEREELCPCCGKLIGVRQIYRHVARTRQALGLELELAHENLDLDMEMDLDLHVGAGNELGIADINDERTYYSISN